MHKVTGDLFKFEADACCITTNGFVTSNGNAVMGRGCAKTASDRDPEIKKLLGSFLRKGGNCTRVIKKYPTRTLVAFPVKPETLNYFTHKHEVVSHAQNKYKLGDVVPGFHAVADLAIIEKSAIQLVSLANALNWKKVVLPRPGCGAGELNWSQVKPILEEHLDDRFYVITFGE